jgi:LmbE family N-acetylglucosaminyl deacetylase
MRKLSITICALLQISVAIAQQVRPAPSGTIYHEIAQLRNLVSVLYVAAHPDDENTRLLAYLVNDQHIRTGYLSLTRGDGGQNLLGSEQGEALGLIRTHELIEARKLDGSEQFFSRAIDFGFSKNSTETFRHWPAEVLAGDAALVIRRFRPDVVICRFPPDSNAGHGQHAASAIVAEMAYKAAGNPSKYPEQFDPLAEPWTPKRLVLNTYRFGSRNTTSEDQYKMQVGQYVAPLGMGVGELAGNSRSVHKSQGAGTPSVPGVQTEYFKLVAGAAFSNSLFEGIDITWNRVGRPDIDQDLKVIIEKFDFTHPDASIPALLAVRKKILEVKDLHWRTQKLGEINETILHCAGVMAELYTKQPQAVPGEQLPVTLRIIARSATPVLMTDVNWGNSVSVLNVSLSADTLVTQEHTIEIPNSATLTQPYWLAQARTSAAMYYMPEGNTAGLPETPNARFATVKLLISGTEFDVVVPLSYKKLDPVKGDLVEQLRIVPDVTVEFTNTLLIAGADGSVQTGIRIHAYKDIADQTFDISSSPASKLLMRIIGVTLKSGADTLIPLTIRKGDVPAATEFDIVASYASKEALALHLIQYNHLPTLQYFTQSRAKVIQPSWKCTAKRIGYVNGAGDNIPAMLRQAGLEVDVLKESDFSSGANLQKYDAIITGIRAVNAEKRMAYWMPMLLKYAEKGGTLIVQYNTLQDMATTNLGPYPMKLSSKRVTEEDATVTFIDPAMRLLTYPNKITDADFKDWVQERGLYFPAEWDNKYSPVFTMHDADEQALTGSTLYAKTGKGHYIYTALSFSRQLPVGNAGAIRLLMNMLSVGK